MPGIGRYGRYGRYPCAEISARFFHRFRIRHLCSHAQEHRLHNSQRNVHGLELSQRFPLRIPSRLRRRHDIARPPCYLLHVLRLALRKTKSLASLGAYRAPASHPHCHASARFPPLPRGRRQQYKEAAVLAYKEFPPVPRQRGLRFLVVSRSDSGKVHPPPSGVPVSRRLEGRLLPVVAHLQRSIHIFHFGALGPHRVLLVRADFELALVAWVPIRPTHDGRFREAWAPVPSVRARFHSIGCGMNTLGGASSDHWRDAWRVCY